MAPIRTAIIGLSASAATSWASSAHLPYLLSPLGRSKYQIVALCNSSAAAARASIAHFGFDPASTRAYGDPAELAADPDVDLVVCSTRVDVHFDTVRPSVEAGKAVFVEWPLAQDLAKVRELVELSREKGGKGMVGLQGRLAVVVKRAKALIEEGRIGKVVSSEFLAAGGTNDREAVSKGLSYFADRAVGGNVFTIGFGHRKPDSFQRELSHT